jgi:GWxTD domain-containing protein
MRFMLCFGVCFVLSAQTAPAPDNPQSQPQSQPQSRKRETIARPMTEKEKKKQDEKLRKELMTPYKKWLNEEVVYIITDEEKKAFNRLTTDDEREQFIEQFWLRRDPTPDTEENEYREGALPSHRRMPTTSTPPVFPGWKTDRGMIYIKYGPADEIDAHDSGGTGERAMEEGGGETSFYPYEDWRYRYIEGVGSNIIIEFVDPSLTGEFHMTNDPSEKDALLMVPGAGLTMAEQMGACG